MSTTRGIRVLSLDDGDARCISQLLIIKEIMHRLEYDKGQELRPWQYFDFVIGTGAGGVVAALLILLRMQVDDAIHAFIRICKTVLAPEGITPAERTAALEDVIKKLGEEAGVSVNTKLLSPSNQEATPSADRCKLALCYMSAKNLSHCRLFRNYPSRQTSYNPTILEAIRATWAAPSLFIPIHLGSEGLEEELVSPTIGNPASEAIKEMFDSLSPQISISCFLSIGSGRHAIQRIPSAGFEGTGLYRAAHEVATDPEATARDIERRIGKLGVYYRFSVDRGLENSIQEHGFDIVGTHTSAYLDEDIIHQSLDDCLHKSEQSSHVLVETLYRSRSTGFTSSHGLPPLSAFFVMRKDIMKKMVDALLGDDRKEQRVMVLSGLGGSGKTQLALKFSRDHEDRFQHIFFVDASSRDSIQNGILSRLKSLGREYQRGSIEDALELLASPDATITRNWCLIFDNADDPTLNIHDFFPPCDHGCIIITTRNRELENLTRTHAHIHAMAPHEALEALLGAAFNNDKPPTDEDRAEAMRIVEHLGYLPLAIIQAGCYIKHSSDMRSYLPILRANRKKLLERPTKTPRDKLRYDHSIYAAFDVTLDILSPRALHLLRILSTVHFTDFPRPLFAIAARSQFKYETTTLLDRGPEFDGTLIFLRDIFGCADGWDEVELVDLLEEFQRHSLVSIVPSEGVSTLRFHPVAHGWANDRISKEELPKYQAAAIRLLVCGTDWEHEDLFNLLLPHINALNSCWDTLHVNDRAAFARILKYSGQKGALMKLTQGIYNEVKAVYGESHLRTSRAELDLADAHGELEDYETMEAMERKVAEFREASLGSRDLETLEAILNLSATLFDKSKLEEAEELQLRVLNGRKAHLGLENKLTAEAMIALGKTYQAQGLLEEEERMQTQAVDILTKLFGRSHTWTLDALIGLSDCYEDQGKHREAEQLQQEVLVAELRTLGSRHIDVLSTSEWIAKTYIDHGRWADAQNMWEDIVKTRKEVQGLAHADTVAAMRMLVKTYQERAKEYQADGNPEEVDKATMILEDALVLNEEISGRGDASEFSILEQLISTYYLQQRFDKMLTTASRLYEGQANTLGDDAVSTVNARALTAWALLNLRRYSEAVRIFEEILEQRVRRYGPNHANVAVVKKRLAETYYAMGKDAEASAFAKNALDILRNSADSEDAVIRELIVLIERITPPPSFDLTTVDDEVPPPQVASLLPIHSSTGPFRQMSAYPRRMNPWSMIF